MIPKWYADIPRMRLRYFYFGDSTRVLFEFAYPNSNLMQGKAYTPARHD
jgi:hypothetical protein